MDPEAQARSKGEVGKRNLEGSAIFRQTQFERGAKKQPRQGKTMWTCLLNWGPGRRVQCEMLFVC